MSQARGDEILDHFVLRVQRHAFSRQLLQRNAASPAPKAKFDALVLLAELLHPAMDAELAHEIRRALLEHARANGLLNGLARSRLENDGLHAALCQQQREHQACRARADDAHLRAHCRFTSQQTRECKRFVASKTSLSRGAASRQASVPLCGTRALVPYQRTRCRVCGVSSFDRPRFRFIDGSVTRKTREPSLDCSRVCLTEFRATTCTAAQQADTRTSQVPRWPQSERRAQWRPGPRRREAQNTARR